MSAAVLLRPDFNADELRQLARVSRDAGQSRRLLALAVIYDGGRRSEAARVGAVGLQTVRDPSAGLQRRRAGGTGRRQGARTTAQARRRAAPGVGRGGGARPRSGARRRGALAAQGLGGVASRPLPRQPGRDHGRARAAEARLRQDVGAAPARCSEPAPSGAKGTRPRCWRSKKELPAAVDAIRATLKPGTATSCGGLTRRASARRTA